jgi:hypothetical protein
MALRAYTLRRPEPSPELAPQVPVPPSNGRTQTRHSDPRWPKHVLVFDTETTTDEQQRLTFGSYRVLRWDRSGQRLELISEGLFHADDLGEWYPAALTELYQYAEAHALRLLSRREFMERVFRRVALDLRGLVVGFNLPFDLSRIAVESGEARGHFHGGFSFVLWDYEKTPGHWAVHPFRPRVCVKSLDSKRAFIGFSRPMATGDATEKTYRGHFLDVRTLAFALSAKSH